MEVSALSAEFNELYTIHKKSILLVVINVLAWTVISVQSMLSISPQKGGHEISRFGKNITILLSADDHKSVLRVAEVFKVDIEQFARNQVEIISVLTGHVDDLIIVGSLDQSPITQMLWRNKKPFIHLI